MAATVGATGLKQRRYSAAPEEGTLTTGQPSAWAQSTAYVRDPTDGGTSRVTANGNLYQCRTAGTSASSGAGPSGTGSDITDGSAHWTYIGAAPNAGDTASGSLILGFQAARNDPMSSLSDNDSGSFTDVDKFSYADFPQWGMRLARRTTAASTKTGYTVSAPWSGTSVGSGAGEELTLAFMEVAGVFVGAPTVHGHTETNPSGGVVTGASLTIGAPHFWVSVWGGGGEVITPGTSHAATVPSGLALAPGCTCLMSISADGYIQMAVAFGVRNAGTYADEWGTTEKSHVFSAAWPVNPTGTGSGALGGFTGTASGTVQVTGSGSGEIASFAGAAAGLVRLTGTGGGALGAFGGSGTGVVSPPSAAGGGAGVVSKLRVGATVGPRTL